jgi:drug/metabolite transporter (DMT)-like permease
MIIYVTAFICVVGLAIGQILFKASATALAQSGSFFAFKPAATLLAAMCLYGITSVAWVWVLQKVELVRVYPLMALAFVIVPILAHFSLGESINLNTFAGAGLIAIGIWISVYK